MDVTFAKLCKEIDWSVLPTFQNCKVKKFIWDKPKKSSIIKLEVDKILPLNDLKNFYFHLVNNYSKICNSINNQLFIKTIDSNWTVDDLRIYLVFVIEERVDDLHYKLLEQIEIVQIDSASVDFIFKNQNLLKNFQKHIAKLANELNQLGFPELNINLKLVEKNYIEDIEIELNKQNAIFIQQNPRNINKDECPIKRNNKTNKDITSIKEAREAIGPIVVKGKIASFSEKLQKNDLLIQKILLVDKTDAIYCKIFCRNNIKKFDSKILREGNIVLIKGRVTDDSFEREKTIQINSIDIVEYEEFTHRRDREQRKRIELCARTKMSDFDGIIQPNNLVRRAYLMGHKGIGITDKNNVQSFPDIYNFYRSLKDTNFKIMYGIVLNVMSRNLNVVINSNPTILKKNTYVIFDLETTGLSAEFNKIIEFGAVKIVNNVLIESKQFFINIHEKLPLNIMKLTGITNSDIENGIEVEVAIKDIMEFIGDSTLVAHNSPFDLSFLNKTMKNLGYPLLKNPVIDTLPLARLMLNQKSYNLQAVCRGFGENYDPTISHRADYDAQVLSNVFLKMLATLEKEKVLTLDELSVWNPKKVYNRMYPKSMTVFARNQFGLKRLFQLVSLSLTTHFQKFPFVFEDELFSDRKNLIIGSSEGESRIFEIANLGDEEKLKEEMNKYDFIEVQPPSSYLHLIAREIITEANLKKILTKIIFTAKKINKTVVATSHPRYLDIEDQEFHKVYINTKSLGGEYHPLFNKDMEVYPDLHFRTTREMMNEFNFLHDSKLIEEIVVINSEKILNLVENIQVLKDKLYTPTIDNVEEKLSKVIYENAHAQYGEHLPQIIIDRINKEWKSITTYNFGVIYWLAYMLVAKSLQDGYLVGSRGSIGSSLVATFLKITEVNPLEPHYFCTKCEISEFVDIKGITSGYDLPNKNCPNCNDKFKTDGHSIAFETFLGFEGDKIPDIDLNFSGLYQNTVHQEVQNLFGESHTFRAGTISTVAQKTAFGFVKKYEEEKHLNFSRAYLDYLVKNVEGTKRTTGQHPGGIIIIPKNLDVEDFTPVNYPANDTSALLKTTHFDFLAIHDNVLKLDLLGHDDPTAIKMLCDLTGINIKNIPNMDSRVISLFSSPQELGVTPDLIMGETTGALGIPEFGTDFVRRILTKTKVQSFADLIAISGLSHGTDVWTNNAEVFIKKYDLNLSQIISCRDDVMAYLIKLGLDKKDAFFIMEQVRKGKGLTEIQEKTMKNFGVPDWYIESCKKISYIFPKAHATAYVKMAWRIAWFKVYHPLAYYATFFSTRLDAVDVFTMIKGKDHVEGKLRDLLFRRNFKKEYGANKNLINNDGTLANYSNQELTIKEQTLINPLLLAQEMLARGYKFQNINLSKSDSKNWIIDQESKSLIPPFIAIDGLGIAAAESIIKARKEHAFVSVEDLQKRTQLNQTLIKVLKDEKILDNLFEKNQISLF